MSFQRFRDTKFRPESAVIALPAASIVVISAGWGLDASIHVYEADAPETHIALDRVQLLVGGYVEVVPRGLYPSTPKVDLLVNEDGRALGLAPSPLANLVGNVVLVGTRSYPDGDEWVGLSKEQVVNQLAKFGINLERTALRVILAGALSKVTKIPRATS